MSQKSKRKSTEAERKFLQGQTSFNQLVGILKQQPVVVGKKSSGGKK